MKRQIISWGMMLAAAFTLTNCAKEIDHPNDQPESNGYPFEIVASAVDTKTANDGMSTVWVDGDKINLFHAEKGSADYKNDNAFTVSDVEAGTFNGELSEALTAQEYDWYALYPYTNKITTPAEQTAGYTYIGYSNGLNQTGYDNMASLKGSVCPLYGVAKAVPAGETPTIKMNHISSVVAIKVTNMNDEPLVVSEASLTAPEDIVGSYYIDITKTPAFCNPSDANYVYTTATVKVTSGATELAKGESATLYLAIKPFTATVGEKLTLSVNNYPKELTLSKDVVFSAGKIKTLNFAYDKVSEPDGSKTVTFDFTSSDELTSLGIAVPANDQEATEIASLTLAKSGITLTSTDGSTATRIWNSKGKLDLRAYKGATITLSVSGGEIEEVSVSGSATTGITTDVSGSSAVLTVAADAGTQKISSITVKYTGGSDEPEISASITMPSSLDLVADASEGTIEFVSENVEDLEVSAYADANFSEFCDWLEVELGDGVVSYVAQENEGAARTAYIRINGSDTKGEFFASSPVVVTQSAAANVPIIGKTIAEFLELEVDESTVYSVTGTIVNIAEINTQYKNASLTISDGNGKELYIYRMKAAEGGTALEELGLNVGDILTVVGNRGEHGGSPQMVNGVYVSHEDREEPKPEGPQAVTVAQFLSAQESSSVTYRLKGEIISLEEFSTTYHNVSLTIKDETGEAYVYRLKAAEGDYIENRGLSVGDIITIDGNRGSYNGSPQMTNGVYVSHEDREEPKPELPADGVVATMVAADLGYANSASVDNKIISVDDNVTLVFKKANSGTSPAYYTSGNAIRMYQNGATLDVSANGKTITKIEITFAQGHYYLKANSGDLSAESTTRTWTGEATDIQFTSTGKDKDHRAYVSKMVITYKN